MVVRAADAGWRAGVPFADGMREFAVAPMRAGPVRPAAGPTTGPTGREAW